MASVLSRRSVRPHAMADRGRFFRDGVSNELLEAGRSVGGVLTGLLSVYD